MTFAYMDLKGTCAVATSLAYAQFIHLAVDACHSYLDLVEIVANDAEVSPISCVQSYLNLARYIPPTVS